MRLLPPEQWTVTDNGDGTCDLGLWEHPVGYRYYQRAPLSPLLPVEDHTAGETEGILVDESDVSAVA